MSPRTNIVFCKEIHMNSEAARIFSSARNSSAENYCVY